MTDGYLANAAEPWRMPSLGDIEPIRANHAVPGKTRRDELFKRDPATLARPWVAPGTPELMHRIGGLEKDIKTGNISYDAANHHAMTQLRARKVALVADFIPDQTVERGPSEGKIAIVGWGSTYGTIFQAVRRLERIEPSISHIHVRYLSPLPKNLRQLLKAFERVVIPEMNNGQFATVVRDKLGIEPIQINKVSGQPFQVRELVAFIKSILESDQGSNVVQMAQGERS
jgi:2-oxoglutarate ferredoxin oxidoreductase subunit alpha